MPREIRNFKEGDPFFADEAVEWTAQECARMMARIEETVETAKSMPTPISRAWFARTLGVDSLKLTSMLTINKTLHPVSWWRLRELLRVGLSTHANADEWLLAWCGAAAARIDAMYGGIIPAANAWGVSPHRLAKYVEGGTGSMILMMTISGWLEIDPPVFDKTEWPTAGQGVVGCSLSTPEMQFVEVPRKLLNRLFGSEHWRIWYVLHSPEYGRDTARSIAPIVRLTPAFTLATLRFLATERLVVALDRSPHEGWDIHTRVKSLPS